MQSIQKRIYASIFGLTLFISPTQDLAIGASHLAAQKGKEVYFKQLNNNQELPPSIGYELWNEFVDLLNIALENANTASEFLDRLQRAHLPESIYNFVKENITEE